MFVGFITETGIVEQVNPIESGVELVIQISPQFAAEIRVDSYIVIDGRVPKVLQKEDKSNLSLLKLSTSHLNQVANYVPKRRVNLERAVRLGEEIPGTFFYGVPFKIKIIN